LSVRLAAEGATIAADAVAVNHLMVACLLDDAIVGEGTIPGLDHEFDTHTGSP
jgi:glutamyl-tRNA reductase